MVHTGEKINVYRVLVGKLEGKKPLGRSRCRWEDNIKMNLNEIRLEGVDWINVGQDRDTWQVNKLKNFRVPSKWKIF